MFYSGTPYIIRGETKVSGTKPPHHRKKTIVPLNLNSCHLQFPGLLDVRTPENNRVRRKARNYGRSEDLHTSGTSSISGSMADNTMVNYPWSDSVTELNRGNKEVSAGQCGYPTM